MILYDFYFLPAEFCDKILHVRNVESQTQITKQDETQVVYLFCSYGLDEAYPTLTLKSLN